ncbi:hypothetical protein DACRYDRAFT_60404, partial [Dacryopinax primogenitus]
MKTAQLQLLFVTMLQHCHPASPGLLWECFKAHLCDDLCCRLQCHFPNTTQGDVLDYGLF